MTIMQVLHWAGQEDSTSGIDNCP